MRIGQIKDNISTVYRISGEDNSKRLNCNRNITSIGCLGTLSGKLKKSS